MAQRTAESAEKVLTVIFTILTLVAFTFIFNLPGIISDPIRSLSEGILEIANKNYQKRIYLKQDDEFGDLANAFNIMAGKLDEYENSNLAKIKFEKNRIETIINARCGTASSVWTKKGMYPLPECRGREAARSERIGDRREICAGYRFEE